MNIFVYTLGCRVNQCESEAIAQSFADRGHTILNSHGNADLIIVNTCTVTSKAEQKARREIRLFSKSAPVLVTGCYAQVNPAEIEGLAGNVVVFPLMRKPELLGLAQFMDNGNSTDILTTIREFAKERRQGFGSLFDFAPSEFSYHSRSYLKIQDGCDNNCGFCRVHIARGPSDSLDSDIVVKRALEIEKKGYHEIVLTGVNLTMYDHTGKGLGGLLQKLLKEIGPDMRFRLSSLEPDHIDDLLLEQLQDHRMQPYFHIPIQSAADKVIRRINRKYDSSHLEYVITQLRRIKDDPFLACDIITGLPGEGPDEFETTRSFLERHGFALMHVFPFSPRPDTALADARDRAPESVRDERALILRNLSARLNRTYVERQVGKEAELILEGRRIGKWHGITGNYLKVDVSGAPDTASVGDLLKVKIVSPTKAEVLPEGTR